jgi:hypothetical protein
MDVVEDVLEQLDRTEEERTFDTEDDLPVSRDVPFCPFAHINRISHSFREERERTDDADLDGDDQVDEYRQ